MAGFLTAKLFKEALLDYKPHIIHFSGHGAGADSLVFENVNGQPALVNSDALANLFRLFASRGVECVVLNACYSEAQALAIKEHIEYVVGMNQSIGDKAAIEFTVGFYTGISCGESYKFAFDLGCNAIELANIPESSTPVLLTKQQINHPKISQKGESIHKQQAISRNEENIQEDFDSSSANKDKITKVNSETITNLIKPNFELKFNNNQNGISFSTFNIKLNYEALNIALQASKWLEGNHETKNTNLDFEKLDPYHKKPEVEAAWKMMKSLVEVIDGDTDTKDNKDNEKAYELAYKLIFEFAGIDFHILSDLLDALEKGKDGYVNGVIEMINERLAESLNFPNMLLLFQ